MTCKSNGLRSLSAARWPKIVLKTWVWRTKKDSPRLTSYLETRLNFLSWWKWFSTSYLYCSSSSLWVMMNWAFLFVNTKFPIIRPKDSGLKNDTGSLGHYTQWNQQNMLSVSYGLHHHRSYPLTACTNPVNTLSIQHWGTFSSSFQQTLCQIMSERVEADKRGAITARTTAVKTQNKCFDKSFCLIHSNKLTITWGFWKLKYYILEYSILSWKQNTLNLFSYGKILLFF